MRPLLALVAILAVLALSAGASSATDDLGEPNPLASACTTIIAIASTQGVDTRSCRRAAPEEYRGTNIVLLHVMLISTVGQQYSLSIVMSKSLWQLVSIQNQ